MTSEAPDLDHFDLDDAWRVGTTLAEQCRSQGLPVTISIQLGEQRVFHAALPGTSADNDSWVDRKSRVVRRFACSSHEVHDRYAKDDPDRFFSAFALSPSQYAPAGGAVPIRVRGTLVGSSPCPAWNRPRTTSSPCRPSAVRAMSDSPEWPLGTGRELRPGQRAEVWIAGVDGRPAQQRSRRRRRPAPDLPVRQRRPHLGRATRGRHADACHPRPQPVPLPAWRQPGRHDPRLRRPAARRLLRSRPARAHRVGGRSDVVSRGGERAPGRP